MDTFFVLSEEEIKNHARELLHRNITDEEYRDVKKMFESGIESWGEILGIAISERCKPSLSR